MEGFYKKTRQIIASDKFFWLAIAVFLIETLWIALSGRYPLPFDEGVHLGIIRAYSHQLVPFMSHQDPHTYALGPITRDPSYLYHYIMSFPYRWFSHYIQSQSTQIVFMRVFSVAFMTLAICVFRQTLLYTKSTKALVNITLLLFILTPITSFTAAQINYDSLFVLIISLVFLFTLKFVHGLTERKELNLKLLIITISLCFLGSLTKYAFLPILISFFAYIAYKLYQLAIKNKQKGYLLNLLGESYRKLSILSQILLVFLLIGSTGLFVERYGTNFFMFKSLNPACDQVLSVESCKQDAPWYRNYVLSNKQSSSTKGNIESRKIYQLTRFPIFFGYWIYDIIYTSFFALSPGGLQAGMPLPLPWLLSYIALVMSSILVTRYFYQLKLKMKFFSPLLLISLIYVGVLCMLTFKDYTKLGQLIEAQGRYILPVLPILYLISIKSFSVAISKYQKAVIYKTITLFVVILCLIEGGGLAPNIIRGNTTWYWPNHLVQKANSKAQAILKRLVFD